MFSLFLFSASVSNLGGDIEISLEGKSDSLMLSGSVGAEVSSTNNLLGNVTYGQSYVTEIDSTPDGQSCAINNSAGTMGDADVTDIAIACKYCMYFNF